MTKINIDKLIQNCDMLQKYTGNEKGCAHSSVRIFDACMRVFDRKVLPAEAITLKVYLKPPVDSYGTATLHRDGQMQIRRV